MIKFDPNNKPDFVKQDFLLQNLDEKGQPIEEIVGYYIENETGVIRIENGDYIDEDKLKVYKLIEYNASDIIKNLIHEAIGKGVIRDLYRTLRQQNLTPAQEGDLTNRINGVFIALGFGFIRGARERAASLSVAGQLTQARKDYLISKIDEAITKL